MKMILVYITFGNAVTFLFCPSKTYQNVLGCGKPKNNPVRIIKNCLSQMFLSALVFVILLLHFLFIGVCNFEHHAESWVVIVGKSFHFTNVRNHQTIYVRSKQRTIIIISNFSNAQCCSFSKKANSKSNRKTHRYVTKMKDGK